METPVQRRKNRHGQTMVVTARPIGPTARNELE